VVIAETLRGELRESAEPIAAEARLQIELVHELKSFGKQRRIPEAHAVRGDHLGLVQTFAPMAPFPSHRPWYEETTNRTFPEPTSGKRPR
jgi:hypothetical protein